MADVKWIKIVTDIFDDEKILLIETLPEADSIIVIWFKLLCLAGKTNNSGVFVFNGIPYTDSMLSTIFRRKESTVKLALQTFEQFGMIQIINNTITIPNWGKHQNFDKIELKNEYMRGYMQEYREKQKLIADGKSNRKANSKTNGKANVSSADKTKTKSKSIDKDIDTLGDLNSFFDSIWVQYPKKEGKGSVSKTQKEKLYDIGIEEMTRAITRYKEKLKADGTTTQFIKQGSTFFNSGYVDYLDANYTASESYEQNANNYTYDGKEDSL